MEIPKQKIVNIQLPNIENMLSVRSTSIENDYEVKYFSWLHYLVFI